MKFDFGKVLLDFDNKPMPHHPPEIVDGKQVIGKPIIITLGYACRSALSGFQDKVSPEEKYKRGNLAYNICNTDDVDLKVEDVTLIKKLIGEFWGPVVVKRVWDLLEKPITEIAECTD